MRKELQVIDPKPELVKIEPPFKRQAEVQRLVEFFFDQPIGTQTPYTAIKELIGEDPQGKGRGILYRARLVLIRDYQIVIGVIPSVGTHRLGDVEILEDGGNDVRKLRRATQRYGRKLHCARPENISQELRSKFFMQSSLLSAIETATHLRSLRALEQQASAAATSINIGSVFEVLAQLK